jgi:ATP phosphoribosyltransferase regulatory subunit
MSKWSIYTPEGVQDILFNDCFVKRNMEERIRTLLRSCGYYEIETPTLEFYDTFCADGDLTPQETMFKFFDQQGRILVLRPDATIPVARIAATKYRDAEYPIRLSYIGNTFRYNELGGGKQKEFTQAGVEILGVNTAESDAEVIATAINALRTAGIDSFQIDIGQVEFFKGLMEETGLPEQDIEQVRILIDRKDYVGVDEIVKQHNISKELRELINELPRLFGSSDIIDRMGRSTSNKRSLAALKNLSQVLEILEDYGLGRYVSVDLGMVQSLNYYTGVIFRGFTHGVGFPVLSGGRYDKLVEKFGKKCPATGFSLGINLVMMALERQKTVKEKPEVDSLVCCSREARKTAYAICTELRKQGLNIEMDIAAGDLETTKKYALSKGIGGILFIRDDKCIDIYNAVTGEVSSTSMNELLNR